MLLSAVLGLQNPFHLQHVVHLKGTREFHDTGPCVVMATPSGLQVRLASQSAKALGLLRRC